MKPLELWPEQGLKESEERTVLIKVFAISGLFVNDDVIINDTLKFEMNK